MNERSDRELLREYAECGVESAFAELARRYIDLVHSVAVRMVVDRHLAEDVTQAVFVALARNARKLANRTVISSWLHITTRNLAAKTVRTEVRRRARENEATVMVINSSTESGWNAIASHLDDALCALGAADRDVIMVRFFERKTAREFGERIGLSEEAAQKRLTRAVERLRKILYSRGVAVASAVLAGTISLHAVRPAPVGLSEKLITQALMSAANTAPFISALAKPLALLTRFGPKPIAATMAVLAFLSLGIGGYLTGGTAAARHRSAIDWQNALNTGAGRETGRLSQPKENRALIVQNASAQRRSIPEILAMAANHFRGINSDVPAWANGRLVLEELRVEEVDEALRELENYRADHKVFHAMAPVLMGLWAKKDSKAALEYSLTQLTGHTLSVALEYVCRTWAAQDPAAAWTWFQETTESGKRPIPQDTWRWLPKEIFAQWVGHSPTDAFNRFSALSFADQESAIFGIAAAANEPEIRPGILAGIAALPDERPKHRLAANVAAAWAKL